MTGDTTKPGRRGPSILGILLGLFALAALCLATATGAGGGYFIPRAIATRQATRAADSTLTPTADPEELSPSETPEPEETPAPPEDLDPRDVLAFTEGWDVIVYEEFSHGANSWNIGLNDRPLVTAFRGVQYGRYYIEAVSHDGYVGWERPANSIKDDFYVSVEAKAAIGKSGNYGLVFQQSDEGYYVYRIDPFTVTIEIRLRYQDEWETLFKQLWPVNLSPDWNKLAVLYWEGRYYFYVNDVMVHSMEEDTLDSGQVGVLYGQNTGGEFTIFEYDNFTLLEP